MTLPDQRRVAAAHSDAVLLERLSLGEIGALGELYDRHQAALRRFVVRMTNDAEDVDDLVHAAFLAAGQSASRYDGRPVCRPWLFGIAVHLLRRRRSAARRWFSIASALRTLRPTSFDSSAALLARRDVERALARLSEPKRVALWLTEVEGLTCPEVAEALGVPIGTVWTRLHAARRELRRMLTPSEGGPA
jgi:RNA polymerase sigma-70 factor (ECF subfamily)